MTHQVEHRAAVGAKDQAVRRVTRFALSQFLTGRDIPQTQREVAAGENGAAIGHKGHAVNL